MIEDVARRFVGNRRDDSLASVDLCLFESDDAYAEFARELGERNYSMRGFYLPRVRVIVANPKHGVGNLRHELVHPLVGDHFELVPAWLNEGLGSL